MSANIVSTVAVRQMSVSAAPTALSTVAPSHVNPFEVRITGSAPWAFRGPNDTSEFAIPADVAYPIPVSSMRDILLTGTGTVTVAFFGHPK